MQCATGKQTKRAGLTYMNNWSTTKLSGQFSRESLGFSTNGMGIARYEND
jgi:hypothetical protein